MDQTSQTQRQALKVSGLSILVNTLLTAAKLLAGLLAHSGAMISDAVHSASDVFSTLIVMVGVVWALSLTFMYPMMVSYRVSFGQLIKNSVVMAIGRLPQTVGIRLIMLVPTIICLAVFMFTGSLIALLVLALYYVMIGFALARFVYASFTNGVFDRFINSHMAGVEINRGLAKEEDLDEEDEEENASETDRPQ